MMDSTDLLEVICPQMTVVRERFVDVLLVGDHYQHFHQSLLQNLRPTSRAALVERLSTDFAATEAHNKACLKEVVFT